MTTTSAAVAPTNTESTLSGYGRRTHWAILAMDLVRVLLTAAAAPLSLLGLQYVIEARVVAAPLHQQLLRAPTLMSGIYAGVLASGALLIVLWFTTALRNLVAIALERANLDIAGRQEEEQLLLPPWPAALPSGLEGKRESFAVVLGELQDRDGARVPNDRSPELTPRWLVLPELALYTGFFITGAIGSGKTSAVIYPCMDQLISFRRRVPVRSADGSIEQQEWKFSGLVTDEKGDFTSKAAEFCQKWGREMDLIRISPGGDWIWNLVYNPNIPTWAIGYQLGWILKNFNKGQNSSDPFWDNAPRELVTEYLGLLDNAESYYTLFDYLDVLVDDTKQNTLHERAQARWAEDRDRLEQIDRLWKSIERRRTGMGVNLRGSLEACARAGIDMFRQPELRRTFCPTRDEYFEPDGAGNVRPRANVFTGFDRILEEGKIVGLDMPKTVYYDAAVFCQVALKTQWQESVLRREATGPDGKLRIPPKFGAHVGYCPTFLMADEAQQSVTPRDAEFKAMCRSKRASVWEACQSHSSIRSAFGSSKSVDADTFIQNSQTHIYLRQSDPTSMKTIQEELGKKHVPKTTVSVTEGGNSSTLSYFHGDIVHQGLGVSSMKSVSVEEKPFMELEELTTLPNNVAVVVPSNGHQILPATICYLRPLFLFEKAIGIQRETPWLDWPEALRTTYGLHNIPQTITWSGWGANPVAAADVVSAGSRLGKFVQLPVQAWSAPPRATPAEPLPKKRKGNVDQDDEDGVDLVAAGGGAEADGPAPHPVSEEELPPVAEEALRMPPDVIDYGEPEGT